MIIEAFIPPKNVPIDVIVDPFQIVCTLSQDWRLSIGVQSNSPIMGGYWMGDESLDGSGPFTRIRLATRDEIVQFEAFKLVTQYTAIL